MPNQKHQAPAIRRFKFRADPADDLDLSYIEQLAAAERQAGRKVTRVHTRRVRVMTGYGISPNKRQRATAARIELIRTFIFK